MKATVTTTITSLVDLDTFAVEHTTDIDATDIPIDSVARAVAVGACRATLASLGHPVPDEEEAEDANDDPRAAAIEAAARSHAAIQYRNVEKWDDLPTVDQDAMRRFVAPLVAAAVGPLLAPVRALAEEWRYKGEHGWGPWQAGEGPGPEGWVLDHAAYELMQVLDAIEVGATSEGGQS